MLQYLCLIPFAVALSYFVVVTRFFSLLPLTAFVDPLTRTGIMCMKELGQAGVSFSGLFNVLSARPNLNMETTYTALMHVATGEYQAFIQECELPCPLW
jgi:hypothetical protein